VNHTDQVVEEAEALDAPGEIWLFRHKILYDPASRKWLFSGSGLPVLKFIGEIRDWVLKICAWLQCPYPGGPVCPV